MARGFGTEGAGSADRVEVPNVPESGNEWTFAWWLWRPNSDPASSECYFNSQQNFSGFWRSDGSFEWDWRAFWLSGEGIWTFSRPSASTWHSLIVTYDSSSTANDPTIYLDGASVSITEVSAPSGTFPSATQSYYFGNNGGITSPLNGRMAETALWQRILTAGEIAALAGGFSPKHFPRNLLIYVPLLGRLSPEHNLATGGGTAGTVTGTVTQNHPRIIYPSRPHILEYTPAAAATTVHRLILMGCGV